CWNINGINHPIKRKRVLSFLKSHQVHVALLQETHLTQGEHEKLRSGWVGKCFYSSFSSKARGVAILINKNSPFRCLSQVTDPAGRFIIVHGRWGSKPVTLASMYAPNVDDPLVIQHYSHAHQTFSRIDLFLISSLLSHRVKACEFLPCFISDHSPIRIQLEAPEDHQGPYRWRLNPHLLTQEEFVGEIKSAIQEFFQFNQSPPSSPDVIWEAFKATIRGKIIAFSSASKKAFRQQMVGLEQELRGAETELYKNNSEENREWVATLQHDLNELSSSKAEGALLRTRSRFYARGDKAGKLLAWQLRREEADRLIPSIRLPDDTTSFAPEAIKGAFQSYYSTLYSTQYDE
uniref:exodeoxyribonuclease III n=1 Tax=Latimeria chalumnae TaxID=7897 RepID=H3AAW1_LATCH